MPIREGRWDCASCGSTRIYGRHVDCPGCGRPRPGGVRFYLAEGEPVVTDAARLADATAGADWICLRCGATTRALNAACGGCGALRGDSPTQRVIEYRNATGGGASTVPEAESDYFRTLRRVYAVPGVRGLLKVLLGLSAACLLLSGLAMARLWYGERTRIVPAEVANATWTRAIDVREPRLVDGEGWTLPDSAQVQGQERRFRGMERRVARVDTTWSTVPLSHTVQDGVETVERTVTEEVQTGTRRTACGTRDRGNGYFEDVECEEPVYETRTRTVRETVPRYRTVDDGTDSRMRLRPVYDSVPVYGTWYRYRAREWRERRVVAEGRPGAAPAWPALPSGTSVETGRAETFTLQVRHGGRTDPVWIELDGPETLARYRAGHRVALRIGDGATGWETDVMPRDSLPACRRWHRGRGTPPPDSLGCTPRARRR